MANTRYFVIADFSEFEAIGREIDREAEILAKMAGYAHIKNLGLEGLETDTGKRPHATVLVNAEMNGARSMVIHPPVGSRLANIEAILEQLQTNSDVSNYKMDENGVSFTKKSGSRKTEFRIMNTAPGEDMMIPETMTSKRTVSLDDIADYDVKGDLLGYEAGRIAKKYVPQEILTQIIDALSTTIERIETSFGEKPEVYYIMSDERLSSIEIIPPIAARITSLEFTSEVRLLRANPNHITYQYGDSLINISRSHLEKFNIRGRIDKRWTGKMIDPPIDSELAEVRDILRHIPVRIFSSDGSEANVAYLGLSGNIKQINIAPNRGKTLDVPGYDSNARARRIRQIFPEKIKYAYCFMLPNRNEQIMVYRNTPIISDRAKWQWQGAERKPDVFDRLDNLAMLINK